MSTQVAEGGVGCGVTVVATWAFAVMPTAETPALTATDPAAIAAFAETAAAAPRARPTLAETLVVAAGDGVDPPDPADPAPEPPEDEPDPEEPEEPDPVEPLDPDPEEPDPDEPDADGSLVPEPETRATPPEPEEV